MGNRFCRDNRCRSTRSEKVRAAHPASKEASCVQVAGTSGVDKFCRGRRNINTFTVRGDDDGASFAPSETRNCAMSGNSSRRFVEVVDFVQRANFVFVGKKDVDVVFDDFEEFGAMTIDAETV